MASCESVYRVTIIWLQFLFMYSSHAAASYSKFFDVNQNLSSYDPQNVNLSVYYETLSPNCSKFIIKDLESVFNNGLISIINLRVVPWGDASVSKSDSSVLCKEERTGPGKLSFNMVFPDIIKYDNDFVHLLCWPTFSFHGHKNGPHECLLNTIEACAINVYKNVNKYFGLIFCIQLLAIEGRQAEWKTCFGSLGLPQKPVIDCYNSRNGTELELQYENETAHLVPPHTLLPWVVVNNQPIRNDYENFTTYVCNAYKGKKDVPIACKSSLSFD